MSTLIPMRWLTAAAGEWIFDNSTVEHCGKDVARLGADSPAMAFGRVGRAVAWRDETGHEYRLAQSGYRVQIDSVFRIPQGDTQEVADDGMRRLRSTTVRPENCAVDMTGSSGVFDLMVHQWRGKGLAASAVNPQLGETPNWAKWVEPEQVREVVGGSPVIGVSYSRRPSELKVALEDSGTPRELYVNTATELWYALSKYFELGYIRYGKGVGREALEEISTRKGGLVQGKGRRMAVESKDSHKKRLSGASCDLADSITLLLHSIRLGTPELQPKARDTKESAANSQGGSRLRDGEAFSIKDESGFGADTLETVMAAHEGDDGRQQNVMESLGAGQSNPANWT